MTPEEKEQLLEALDRIQYQPEQIFIRQGDGKNLALSELPALEALEYVCRWLRINIAPSELPTLPAIEHLCQWLRERIEHM